MAWHVMMTDEYGTTSIQTTVEEVEDGIEFAKKAITEENVNNALTSEEKKRHWEYFFPQIFAKDKVSKKVVYAGKDSKGEHCCVGMDKDATLEPVESAKGEVTFYLVELDREDWYAEDGRGNVVNSLQHDSLFNKTFYFLRKV